MDKSLKTLCDAIKKIIIPLKPQQNELSFILLIGRDNQGKTTLLQQSHFEHVAVDADCSAEIYFNQHGLIVELGESWLNQSKNLLEYTLKQINRCHRTLKITGIILCIDISCLLISEPLEFIEHSKAHTHLLTRFGQSLTYRVDTTIIFTKLDALAGFCEFFQNEHPTDLLKPLGFSLSWKMHQGKFLNNYKTQFEHLIEVLGQQVIHKMHPARSSVKRTLIREFPLQLASLGRTIQALIQTIPPALFRVQSLYFTSGEQGGVSLDRLNKKIQHEYALTVQDKFPQSINHRAYFIEGALSSFQMDTKHRAPQITLSHQWVVGILMGAVGSSLLWIGTQHFKSAHSLDDVSKELLTYDGLIKQNTNEPSALYHLSKASTSLDHLTTNGLFLPTIQQLKVQLQLHTQQHLQGNFLPTVLADIEQTIIDTRQSNAIRYQALKIYLMLAEPTHFVQANVLTWFRTHWKNDSSEENLEKKLALLKQAIKQPLQPITINRQIVSDVRNYLNALPAGYLYYSLAKDYFPPEKKSLTIEGFDLADNALPVYFTKTGFQQIIGMLPTIAAQLQTDNWVLARQDLSDLPALIQSAYCYEYVLWWQNFMHKTSPHHFKDYAAARQLTQSLHQSNAINTLVMLIQQQTSPELGENSALFNREISSKFTELSLMSHSAVKVLTSNLNELELFLTTLSMVNDQGRTAFTLTKARFDGDKLSNPLSALYNHVQQLPEPVATWAKQVADDTWFILINDTRNHINQQWQQTVIQDYHYHIADRYPFDAAQTQEVAIEDFDRFFSTHGVLNNFIDQYLKPFLDMSQAQWQLKELNNYVLPISTNMITELIRANVISNMFFTDQKQSSMIQFSLQKVNLDPVVSNLQLVIGNTKLSDTQSSDMLINFHWPESNAKLTLNLIEGKQYELDETGPWAFFKMLQKVNVLVDEQDSSNLQILFEVNGNSGRYILKTQNQINPFIPGILNGFTLTDSIA